MASIRREITIDARPHVVWDALRDFGAIHERLAVGFVVDAELDGEDRIATFFNGAKVRERFVALDEEERRLVYAITDGALGLTHYNAAAQVFAEGEDRTRFVWVIDLLPHELAPTVAALMEQGLTAIEKTLEP